MSLKSVLLGLVAAAAITAGAAQADVLTFTYNGPVNFGAVLDGTLQPDNNTFVVTGYQSFSVGGAPIAYTPSAYFESADANIGAGQGYSGNGTPTVTLDGSYIDFAASDGTNNLIIAVNDQVAVQLVGNAVLTSGVFGAAGYYAFVPADWSASVTMAAVPEPATLAVFGFALVGFAALRRRKRAKG